MGRVKRRAAPADGAVIVAEHDARLRQIEAARTASGGGGGGGGSVLASGSISDGDGLDTSNSGAGSHRPLAGITASGMWRRLTIGDFAVATLTLGFTMDAEDLESAIPFNRNPVTVYLATITDLDARLPYAASTAARFSTPDGSSWGALMNCTGSSLDFQIPFLPDGFGSGTCRLSGQFVALGPG